MNLAKKSVLLHLQELTEYACNSFIRKKCIENLNINDRYIRGEQWLDEELNKEMDEIGATQFTLNILKPEIDKYLSLLTKSSKRVGFAPASDLDYDQEQAEITKYWAMNVQTQNQYPFYSQLKCRDVLSGGMGWSKFYFDNGKYYYEYVNPRFCEQKLKFT